MWLKKKVKNKRKRFGIKCLDLRTNFSVRYCGPLVKYFAQN